MTNSSSNAAASAAASATPHRSPDAATDFRPMPPRLASVLQMMVQGFDESRWTVRRLAQGRQAHLFMVRAPVADLAFGGGTDAADEFIVKLYRSDAPDDRDATRDEFECLYRLHARLDGASVHGWKVHCPRPLFHAESLAALAMTRVPGMTLSWHIGQGDGPDPDVLDSISRATVSALLRYWAGDPRLYGDLILNNILCDIEERTISFVDPGMPDRYYLCETAPLCWYPASRDLGFLLYWTASLIRPSIAHPILHARQKRMTFRIIKAFLDTLTSVPQRLEATAEIEACARIHLARMPVSSSPRGLWRRLVRSAATQTIERMFQELRGATGAAAGGRNRVW